MRLFNIGAEGQLYFGAIGAAGHRAATSHGQPTVVIVPAMIVAGAAARRSVGGDPRGAAGVRAHQRDHHLADAQLRRGAAPQLPDLRQPLVLAGHAPATGAALPAGQGAARCGDLAASGPSARSRSRSASCVAVVVAVVVWVLYARTRFGFEVQVIARLAARRALRGHAHAAQDPRRDVPVRARSPGSAARARSATSATCSTPAGCSRRATATRASSSPRSRATTRSRWCSSRSCSAASRTPATRCRAPTSPPGSSASCRGSSCSRARRRAARPLPRRDRPSAPAAGDAAEAAA